MSRQIQRPPRPATSKAIWMGVWRETRAVHTCLSPSLVNYWTGRHTPPLSLALRELLMHGAVQWPHLERAAPPLKPGLKCGLAPLNGRHARKHTQVHTHTWHPKTPPLPHSAACPLANTSHFTPLILEQNWERRFGKREGCKWEAHKSKWRVTRKERENRDSQFITDQKCAQPSEREISSGIGVTQTEGKNSIKIHPLLQLLGGCCPS